jgi:hypothetical protein
MGLGKYGRSWRGEALVCEEPEPYPQHGRRRDKSLRSAAVPILPLGGFKLRGWSWELELGAGAGSLSWELELGAGSWVLIDGEGYGMLPFHLGALPDLLLSW